MNAITSLVQERSKRVALADRNALAYLYNAPEGAIQIGPEHVHDPRIVQALVQRLHPLGLLRGRASTRTLSVTPEGNRVVEHWLGDLTRALSADARERVVDSLRWLGTPPLPVDAELEAHQLARCKLGERSRGLNFIDYTWRTDLCLALARSLEAR